MAKPEIRESPFSPISYFQSHQILEKSIHIYKPLHSWTGTKSSRTVSQASTLSSPYPFSTLHLELTSQNILHLSWWAFIMYINVKSYVVHLKLIYCISFNDFFNISLWYTLSSSSLMGLHCSQNRVLKSL